jgi:hypothetical protein
MYLKTSIKNFTSLHSSSSLLFTCGTIARLWRLLVVLVLTRRSFPNLICLLVAKLPQKEKGIGIPLVQSQRSHTRNMSTERAMYTTNRRKEEEEEEEAIIRERNESLFSSPPLLHFSILVLLSLLVLLLLSYLHSKQMITPRL